MNSAFTLCALIAGLLLLFSSYNGIANLCGVLLMIAAGANLAFTLTDNRDEHWRRNNSR